MHHLFILPLLFFFLVSAEAQDERYYRQMLSEGLPALNMHRSDLKGAHSVIRGTQYRFDLNGDREEEVIEPQKRDGVDWIEIRNSSQIKLFEGKLLSIGSESHLFKIKLVNLSPEIKALILFMDEGKTSGKKFESTGRIFIMSYEKNDLSKMSMVQGPHFFHEKESQREQYWRRNYNVNIYDIDHDGVREIAVQYNHIQRVMKYVGKGEWKRY